MDNKTLSIVSYITIIGWLIAFFVGKEKADDLLKYHLRQSFGLFIVNLILGIAINIIVRIVPSLALFLSLLYIVILILIIIGIINAANGAKKPLPIIGNMFEKSFGFIG
ncbi:MAG: DUF4870 domain-containing protein [Flavobacteriaceae bacterium]|jgi:uncharacterized membrane protein|nr:DUF4870 domain-containing protein [Flavobacteriaceae bacterium]